MQGDLVLFCKSYRRDFLRLKRLILSIEKYNEDLIPLYISTPEVDKNLLLEVLGTFDNYHWVSDESIAQISPGFKSDYFSRMSGGTLQQIIKAEFWRLGIATNYLCLDSDSIFIKKFYKENFLTSEGHPFTVAHQNKEFFQMAINRGHSRVVSDLKSEAERVQALFERAGPNYFFAPSPFVWSAHVWQSFAKNYLEPRGTCLWEVLTPKLPESLIYGEALLKYKAIPMHAIEPLFRVYNYDWEFYMLRRLGETEEKLRENFIGVIYQSSWESERNFGPSNKSLASQFLKKIKRFIRFMQSYF